MEYRKDRKEKAQPKAKGTVEGKGLTNNRDTFVALGVKGKGVRGLNFMAPSGENGYESEGDDRFAKRQTLVC